MDNSATTKRLVESVASTLVMERQSPSKAQVDEKSPDFKRYIPAESIKTEFCDDCGEPLLRGEEFRCNECTRKRNLLKYPEPFLRSCNVPEIYIKASFDNFVGGGIDGLRKAAACDPLKNIVIQGVTGSGKTRIACSILRELITSGRSDGKHYWFMSAYRFIYEMLDTMGRDGGRKLDIVDRYAKYDLLVIDDLGFDDESKWATGQFYALIDMRVNEGLPTIITTNVKPEDLARDLGARIASRLAGMDIFVLPFTDYRKKRG
jgi:chromosomal replication initiation ATPase DnaA